MRRLWGLLVPTLLIAVGSGCATSGKQAPVAEAEQQERMKLIVEQADKNASMIRELESQVEAANDQIRMMENRLNTTTMEQNAVIQEIKENIKFTNDQIVRLDNSLRSQRPGPLPQSASVFKPGGFDVQAAYKGALDEYYAKRYETAISGFNEILTVAATSQLADNAQYWIGECYYSMGNYERAIDAFNKVFNYPESNKLAAAHVKTAMAYQKAGNTTQARTELNNVVRNYPGTDEAALASRILNQPGE